jgi:hypothetical protein
MFTVPNLSRAIHGDEKVGATLTCLDAQGEKHCVQPRQAAINIMF